MTVPLRYIDRPNIGADLRQFTDANFDWLQYRLLLAFADDLRNGGNLRIFQGNGGAELGRLTDTARTQRTNTDRSRIPNFPGTGRADTNYRFAQTRNATNDPTGAALNNSYLIVHPTNLGDLIAQDDLMIIRDNVITPAAMAMFNRGVGTYQVSTRVPGAGYINIGRWFRDTRYQFADDYRLWLRVTGDTPGGTERIPVIGQDDGVMEAGLRRNDPLMRDVLLPLLRQVAPRYNVVDTAPADNADNFGMWTDTRLVGTTNTTNPPGQRPGASPGGRGDDYSSTSTPSGAVSNIARQWLVTTNRI